MLKVYKDELLSSDLKKKEFSRTIIQLRAQTEHEKQTNEKLKVERQEL